MKLIITKNYRELSKKASEMIINEILKKTNLTIGFATGKTPLKTYKNLVKVYKKKKADFSKIKTFNLDEYYPIKKEDKKSYYHYMFKNLFDKINVNKKNINLLDGSSRNPQKECKEYENKIKKSPIDLQILGIGINGHIGFNEPNSPIDSKTRLINLAPETIKKDKYFKRGLTVGVSTILKSKKILLLASGKKKAKVIFSLIKGKKSKKIPATLLKEHKNLIVIIDKKAGSLL